MSRYRFGAKSCHGWKNFPIHEIGRIDSGRGFQTGNYVFKIGRNPFYNRKNKIPMKIPESKRSKIGRIVEFRGIPIGFPNQGRGHCYHCGRNREGIMPIAIVIVVRGITGRDILRRHYKIGG
jgi:hypothetical protein